MSKRSLFLFLAVGFLWGIPYLLMKVAVAEIAPTVIVFSRVVIGTAILLPIAIKNHVLLLAIRKWRYIIPYALFEMIGPWILITTAEKKISSGLAGLLVATAPFWTTLLAGLHGDRSAWHKKRLAGLLVGFIGVAFVVGLESFSGKQDLLSIGMMLLATMGYSWAPTMVNRKIPEIDGKAINGISMAATAIFYLPFAIVQWPSHAPSAKAIFSIVGLGVFSTALAFVCFFMVMKDLGTARASLVTYINTVVAVLLGIVLLHEDLTLGIVIGLPLVLVGSYFASRKPATASL